MSELYSGVIQQAVHETAQAFHLRAEGTDEHELVVPCSYQVIEPGFRPFRGGKASADQLQGELNVHLQKAQEKDVDIGLESSESLAKLLIQLGLGIDCSNLAYRSLTLVHERLGLSPYAETVQRQTAEVMGLYQAGLFVPRDDAGRPKSLLPSEERLLERTGQVSAVWLARHFRRDPEFIIGSVHICAEGSSVQIDTAELLPGDLVAFHNASKGRVSHVGVVAEVDREGNEVTANFWHSWHTRVMDSGLRLDTVSIRSSEEPKWSHEGLANRRRYRGYSFWRPIALTALYGVDSSSAKQ